MKYCDSEILTSRFFSDKSDRFENVADSLHLCIRARMLGLEANRCMLGHFFPGESCVTKKKLGVFVLFSDFKMMSRCH